MLVERGKAATRTRESDADAVDAVPMFDGADTLDEASVDSRAVAMFDGAAGDEASVDLCAVAMFDGAARVADAASTIGEASVDLCAVATFDGAARVADATIDEASVDSRSVAATTVADRRFSLFASSTREPIFAMRWLVAGFACVGFACGSSTASRTEFRPPTVEVAFDVGAAVATSFAIGHAIAMRSVELLEALAPEPGEPVYPPNVRSVRFATTVVVRAEPSLRAAELGVVRRGTRSGVLRAAEGDRDCPRWIEIAPRGWACEKVLEPSTELPTPAGSASIAALEADDNGRVPLVPGLYGVVYGETPQAFKSRDDIASGASRALQGSTSIRAVGSVTIDGERYVQTSQGDLIAASSIAYISPSKFKGVVIADPTKLPAWVRTRGKPRDPAPIYSAPGEKKAVGKLAARTVVAILELSDDGKLARIADDRWIARADLRAATLAEPPEGTTTDEKWFDVDLDEQVLVAYEGKAPVYATLVSSGKPLHDTPTIIARIGSKHETAHMVNNKPTERYSVADVPWTMYYDHNYALHTSYWHDGFGEVRSHGCINLAPRDARLLYRWSSPDVPPGWSSVHGDVDHPGSLVRVHSHRVTAPPFVGYARTLHDRDS